ncbi:hypothetical protein HDU80_011018 [Chytriomyces hyalinus]|nr:hypothetical protein HDU80_011018 [Chytriomyces hyalinus]
MDPTFAFQYLNSIHEQPEQQQVYSNDFMRRMSMPVLATHASQPFNLLSMTNTGFLPMPPMPPMQSLDVNNLLSDTLTRSPDMGFADFSAPPSPQMSAAMRQPRQHRYMSLPTNNLSMHAAAAVSQPLFDFETTRQQLEQIQELEFLSLLQGTSSMHSSSMHSSSMHSSSMHSSMSYSMDDSMNMISPSLESPSQLSTPTDTPVSSPLISAAKAIHNKRNTKRDVTREEGFEILLAANPTSHEDLIARKAANEASDKPARFKPTDEELEVLSKIFQKNPFPSVAMRTKLAERMGLTIKQVQFWFQNRRQTMKLGGIHVIKPRKRPSATTRDRTECLERLSEESKFFYVDPALTLN